jgi:hypothetical protein
MTSVVPSRRIDFLHTLALVVSPIKSAASRL